MDFLKTCLDYFLNFFGQYPTKIFLAEILFCFKAKKRKLFWLRFVPCVVFLLIIWPYFIGYFHSWSVLGGWFALSFVGQYLFSILMIWFCFDFKWQQVLFYSASAYAIEHCANALNLIFGLTFKPQVTLLMFRLIHVVELAVMYSLAYFIFVRKIVKLDKFVVKNFYVWGISAITVCITNVLSQWMAHIGTDIYHNVYDILLCILLLFTQYGTFFIAELAVKNQNMKLILHLSEEQHKMYKENIELINLKCHDLKHQIAAVRGENNALRLEDSLKRIENSIMIYDSMLKTGNPALDVILTEKKLVCEKHGIRFSAIVDGSCLDFIEEEDIYAMFGNALDNAIENVMEVEEPENRVISIRVVAQGKILSVHMDNVCNRELQFRDGLPVTTKEDKRFHGYGMRSIQYIVKKYGGTLGVFVKNGQFNLNAAIPIREKKR